MRIKTLLISLLLLVSVLFCKPCLFAGDNGTQESDPMLTDDRKAAAQELNGVGLKQVRTKDYASAEKTFENALIADPENAGIVYNLAGTLLMNRKEEQAVSILEKFIEKRPQEGALHVRLGDAYFNQKKIELATISYERAYQLNADFPEVLEKLGSIYLLNSRFAEAEKFLDLASQKSPKDLTVLTNLSSVYLINGKLDKTVATAKRALQIKASKELYLTLATAYERNKDFANALIAYERARDLGDNREETLEKIKSLKSLT